MKDNLTLLKFPLIKENLNQYRIEQALLSMDNSESEYETVETLLVALVNYFSDMRDSEMILHDINKLRASVEVFFEQQD